MDVDMNRVRSLLLVNKVSLGGPPEAIRALLRGAQYTEQEIEAALALLAAPPTHSSQKGIRGTKTGTPSVFRFFQKEQKQAVPKERKTNTYVGAGMTGIVVEHENKPNSTAFLLILFVLFLASLYVSGALSHVSYAFKLPLLCEGVLPGEAREACRAGEEPVWKWEWEELLLP